MATLADVNIAMREQVTHLERRFGRRRVYFVAGAIGLVLLLLVVRLVVVGKKPAPQPAPRPVIVAKVVTRDVPLYLDEIGTCVSVESVKVQAQVSGQIIAREFQDGADVKKGDLLFTIDPRPYQAALDQAKGQLAQAQSQLVLDQITLKRQQELRARGVNAPQDLDVAQGTFNNDKAKVQAAQAAVDAAQVNLDYCTIRSPLDGRAGLRTVDVGNVISGGNAGGVVLLSIDRFDQIYTDFTVAEPDVALVRHYLGNPNMKVQTDSPNDDQPPRLGDLYFIDNVVQPGSGTVKARGITPNPDRSLWPGEFVRVRFILDQIKDAKLVPAQAVQISQRGPFIFVLKQDNTVDQRPVRPGQRQDGDMMVIEDGVKPGETVVVTGQLALAPGTKVAPQIMESGQSSANPTPKAPAK
ncbi:MAG: efflux RND transporter periplasmic adaptor subunit [Verrucomicrobia bacterium]|nr:MAG: efflux RND transporter periplasmic adaptor subunit [Verrucomicrobiota bacterium]